MALGKRLNPTLRSFIEAQPLFFVATAARDGRVNLSPKGLGSLVVVDEQRIRWLNLSGSGNETAAHLRDTPRMTLMFCAFTGDPMILRVYGTASVVHPHDAGWNDAVAQFPAMAGSRQVFDLVIEAVQVSCGTGVPRMRFEASRGEGELLPFYAEMGPEGVRDYWRRKNTQSIDGQPTGVVPDDASP
ncbi:MAG: pyridoxamine 5'-phosphate oxidase family protein [Pseudomonadota bacterium]